MQSESMIALPFVSARPYAGDPAGPSLPAACIGIMDPCTTEQ